MNEEQAKGIIKSIRARAKGPRREPSATALERARGRARARPNAGTKQAADAVLERARDASKGKTRGRGQARD